MDRGRRGEQDRQLHLDDYPWAWRAVDTQRNLRGPPSMLFDEAGLNSWESTTTCKAGGLNFPHSGKSRTHSVRSSLRLHRMQSTRLDND